MNIFTVCQDTLPPWLGLSSFSVGPSTGGPDFREWIETSKEKRKK
jgi:hypothetical protein